MLLSLFRRSFRSSFVQMINGKHLSAKNKTESSLIYKSEVKDAESAKIQKINKAMKAYLERAQQHEKFIKEQIEEYEIGKRHLANMMGVDPNMFTQEDIDKAIEYLMPSGLFDKKARPIMKHPSIVFPEQKAAQFDTSGRPYHSFFYTRYSNYHEVLYDIVEKMHELNSFQSKMFEKGIIQPPEESKLILDGSDWLKKVELETMLIEEISDSMYSDFITTMNRLTEHPYSFRVKDHIMQFRKQLKVLTTAINILPIQNTENGISYITAEGFRKKSKAKVTVFGNGVGKFIINGNDIQYFQNRQDREQILFPLQFTELLGKIDVEASVVGRGTSAQAGAVRHGLSLALCSFVTTDIIEKMRLAGLLTRDRRTAERKKTGQKGPRAKYTWKKR